MPSSKSKFVKLGLFEALFHGIQDNDPYFRDCIRDQVESEFQIIASVLIPADSICIDIGANIGIKTFVMAKQASDGMVLSIEGAPHVYEALALNIKNNKLYNVLAENVAITDKTGTVRFVDNSAWGHLETADCDTLPGTDVPGITLGDLLNKHAQINMGKIRFVKIDTEGHEYRILKNAHPSVFTRDNPWIYFEFNSYALCALGDTNPKEMLTWLFSNFQYVFRVERKALHSGEPLLRQFRFSDLARILHDNIVSNGSVDDFLVTNRESALHEIHPLLLPSPFAGQLLALQAQLGDLAKRSHLRRWMTRGRRLIGCLRKTGKK